MSPPPADLFKKANWIVKLTMPNQPDADIARVQANSRAAPAPGELRYQQPIVANFLLWQVQLGLFIKELLTEGAHSAILP
jgi:hypothetical protein